MRGCLQERTRQIVLNIRMCTPSYVAFMENGDRLVGETPPRIEATINPERTL
jgi:molecular chaperone DnaK (HSP70)